MLYSKQWLNGFNGKERVNFTPNWLNEWEEKEENSEERACAALLSVLILFILLPRLAKHYRIGEKREEEKCKLKHRLWRSLINCANNMCMISFLHITAQHSLAFLTSFLLRPKWVIFELAFLPIISLSVGVARNENVHRESLPLSRFSSKSDFSKCLVFIFVHVPWRDHTPTYYAFLLLLLLL